jgi:hypothetical protein
MYDGNVIAFTRDVARGVTGDWREAPKFPLTPKIRGTNEVKVLFLEKF